MIPRTLFSPEHEAFRDTVKRFIAEHVTPHHADWEKAGQVPRALWREAGTLGLLCCNVPEEYGGMGGDFLHSAILVEEFADAGATGPPSTCTRTSSRPTSSNSAPRRKSASGSRRWPRARLSSRWA